MSTQELTPDGGVSDSDPLVELRAASSHPLVRCFPRGALIVFDHDLRYLAAGGLGLAEVGLSRSMLEGKTIFEAFPSEVARTIEGPYRQALLGHESHMDVPHQGRIYLQRLAPLFDEYGEVIAGFGFTQDVTSERQAEKALRESEERFRLAFDYAPIGKALVAVDGRWLQVNRALCEITGYLASELQGLTLADITDLDDRSADVNALDRLVAGEVASHTLEKRYVTAGGSPVWVSESVTLMRHEDGSPLSLIVQVVDISERKQNEVALTNERRRLKAAALTDDLTGLPNRRALLDRLEGVLARAQREGREVAVLFCDLDGFKRVNDTSGHAAGDAVLIACARRLQQVLRKGDTLARVGGDEFVVVVESRGRPPVPAPSDRAPSGHSAERLAALGMAERIGEALRRPVTYRGIEHVVTTSIGITFAGRVLAGVIGHVDAEGVVQEAEAAMYRAKGQGKDRFAVFDSALQTSMAQRGHVESVLRQALRRGPESLDEPGANPTLEAAYQPIFDLGSGRLTAFEALARLTDGDGVAIGPDQFIPVAEEAGMIGVLGDRMLDLACGQLAAWRCSLPGLTRVRMSVNVSALQVQHASLGESVRGALKTHGLGPGDLILELTESTLLEASEPALEALTALREDGVGIAIDDFGTGYASLMYLATLPVSSVKIDRSFTSALPGSRVSMTIVNAVASLASELGLECVVEGVETEEQSDALPMGVQVQGWLTGRPQPPDVLEVGALVSWSTT